MQSSLDRGFDKCHRLNCIFFFYLPCVEVPPYFAIIGLHLADFTDDSLPVMSLIEIVLLLVFQKLYINVGIAV